MLHALWIAIAQITFDYTIAHAVEYDYTERTCNNAHPTAYTFIVINLGPPQFLILGDGPY